MLDIDRAQPVIETQVSFEDIKQGIVPQNKEFWLNVSENDLAAKLRIKISYVQNEVLKWDAEAKMLVNEIKNEAGILQQVRIFIEQLRAPFGFLTREIDAANQNVLKKNANDAQADNEPDHKYFEQEKKMEQQFDAYANQIAKRYKMETIPWLEVTKVVVWIFLALTLLSCLKRTAFVSLTVATLALYVLDNPRTISRNTFRVLVLLIAISWGYDFLWLFLVDSSAAEEDEEDGGNEYKLRRFVRLISYICLMFKVIVVLVFWKDSLDFKKIMHNGAAAMADDDDADAILAQ